MFTSYITFLDAKHSIVIDDVPYINDRIIVQGFPGLQHPDGFQGKGDYQLLESVLCIGRDFGEVIVRDLPDLSVYFDDTACWGGCMSILYLCDRLKEILIGSKCPQMLVGRTLYFDGSDASTLFSTS
jgi:hypothetical protein